MTEPTSKADPHAIEAAILTSWRIGTGENHLPLGRRPQPGGPHPDGRGPLMIPVRRVAVRLAHEGRVVIYRKGKPVNPDDFRGVYRIGLPRQD
jgi:hypothetical protein